VVLCAKKLLKLLIIYNTSSIEKSKKNLIRRWWYEMGSPLYPGVKELLLIPFRFLWRDYSATKTPRH